MGHFEEQERSSPQKIEHNLGILIPQRQLTESEFRSPGMNHLAAPNHKKRPLKGNLAISPILMSERGGVEVYLKQNKLTPVNSIQPSQSKFQISLAEQLMQQINLLGHGI